MAIMPPLRHLGAVHAEQRDRFPRGRLWRRMRLDTEAAMGTFWLLILTPILAATFATFFALTLPPETVRNGIVVGPSAWTNLGFGALGAFCGVAAAFGGTLAVLLVTYLWRGDSLWSADNWSPGAQPPWGTFRLRSKTKPALDTIALGDFECWIKTPDGQVWEPTDSSYGGSGPAGLFVSFLHVGDGTHEIRWYGTRGKPKHVEIARATIPIRPSSPT